MQATGRKLSWKVFLALVVVYAAIIQVGGRVIGSGIKSDDGFETAHNVLLTAIIPIAISSLFVIAIATWLGWWRPIVTETRRVQRWVWVVPITLLSVAILGASWGNLLDQSAELILLLLVLVSLVGFTEELMFRGVGLLTFRGEGLSEARVALWSSLVFGAVHLSNAIGTGGSAVFQAAVVSLSGYFFYLTRRVAGTILLAMLVHGSQDFVILTGQVGVDPSLAPNSILVIVAMIGLAITVWVRRHKIELEEEVPGVGLEPTRP